jgi:hypothetical protein
MEKLKKFEEFEYTSSEKNQYQSRVDSIVDKFARPIKMMKFEKEIVETPRIKVNVNIDNSEESTLSIKFDEISFKIYQGQSGRELSVYKPGNGWKLTHDSIEDIYSTIKRCSNYLSLSEKELSKIYNSLRILINNEDHIVKYYNI